MQTEITLSRASTGQSEEVSAAYGDMRAMVTLQSELGQAHEQIATLEAERLTWLRANNEVAALNIDLIVGLSDLKDAVRAYTGATSYSQRGKLLARLKELAT